LLLIDEVSVLITYIFFSFQIPWFSNHLFVLGKSRKSIFCQRLTIPFRRKMTKGSLPNKIMLISRPFKLASITSIETFVPVILQFLRYFVQMERFYYFLVAVNLSKVILISFCLRSLIWHRLEMYINYTNSSIIWISRYS